MLSTCVSILPPGVHFATLQFENKFDTATGTVADRFKRGSKRGRFQESRMVAHFATLPFENKFDTATGTVADRYEEEGGGRVKQVVQLDKGGGSQKSFSRSEEGVKKCRHPPQQQKTQPPSPTPPKCF